MSRPRSTEPSTPEEKVVYRHVRGLAGYMVVAAVFFWPILIRLTTHVYSHDQFNTPGKGGDGIAFQWNYWWIHEALATGKDVIHCDWVFPPSGLSIIYHFVSWLPILLTYPLGRLFGPVAGNNLMMVLLFVAGAWCYYIFVLRTLRVSQFSAFVAGVLFAFCPWFLWKGGSHPFVGFCWWGTALGLLVTGYSRGTFSFRDAILFAVFVWASFWSSYLEFFMLGVVGALTVAVFEIRSWTTGDRSSHKRLLFFVPSLFGFVSLLILQAAPHQSFETDLVPGPSFIDLIPSAKLSIFSWLGLPNRTATIIPHSFVYLGLVGVWAAYRKRAAYFWPGLAMIGLTLLLVLDPYNVPSTLVRKLPRGEGFRGFERFIPFTLFFILMFSCAGLEFLKNGWQPKRPAWTLAWHGRTFLRLPKRGVIITGLLAFAFLELYPFLMGTTEVKRLPITPEVRAELDNGRFCLIVPEERYWPVYDTYQIALNMPCVNLYGWSHMPREELYWRQETFPSVYKGIERIWPRPNMPDIHSDRFLSDLERLDIGFLLFTDKADASHFKSKGRILLETDDEVLFALDE